MKKKILLLLGSILLCINTFAQDKKGVPFTDEEINKVFVAVQVHATYPDGMVTFHNDFKSRFNIPEAFINEKKPRFQVIARFIVELDGSFSDIKVVRDPGFGIGEETIRVLKEIPKWKPAIFNSRNVRSQFTLPISVYIEEPKDFFVNKEDIITEPKYISRAYRDEGNRAYIELFKKEYSKQFGINNDEKAFIIDFIVELDGSLSDIKVYDGTTGDLVPDVSNIVHKLGKWNPGRVENKPVRSYHYIIIK
ncbi:MAG: energy transducer TonB [Flavobacteriaceae bacterium]|jgi:hypothetical protein|nr:energy transducer TonB [Flavobacteriaceae bacterium]